MARKIDQHKRRIKIADFELPRGAVTIEALMAMPPEAWGHLRNEINLRREVDPKKPLARCRLCRGPVFIRSYPDGIGGHLPLYSHYSEGDRDCPWYEGGNLRPDDARAAQYHGHQESALHRRLCEVIEQVARTDTRCEETAVNTYLRPAIHKRGRWPDVFLNMSGLGRFALEVQLAKPFAPEIAARHVHYEREGVNLLWVFHTLEEPLPQGFRDVITMQRGNAFIFDREAEVASFEKGTLVLKSYLENGCGGWLEPRLVTLDDLDTSGRSAFVEDRRSKRIREYCTGGRDIWWKALHAAKRERPRDPFYAESFNTAWTFLIFEITSLKSWADEYWSRRLENGRAHMAQLFAILCSIAHSAQSGKPTLYITDYKGEGSLLAMLNSKLSNEEFRAYADLIEVFLKSTPLADLLARESLKNKLSEARAAVPQAGRTHPVWHAAGRLFPEALDSLIRAELDDLGQLPAWAGRRNL